MDPGTASYAGNPSVTSAGASDVFVLKVDSSGAQVWLQRLGSTGADAGQGIALTPYSYERLDSLTGYEAGMPNPGFYD